MIWVKLTTIKHLAYFFLSILVIKTCLIISSLQWLGMQGEGIKLFKPSLMFLNVPGCRILKNRLNVLGGKFGIDKSYLGEFYWLVSVNPQNVHLVDSYDLFTHILQSCSIGTGNISPIPVKYHSIYLLIKTTIMSHYHIILAAPEHLKKQCTGTNINHTWPGNDAARIKLIDFHWCTSTLPFVQKIFSCMIFSWWLLLLGIKCEVIKLFKLPLMYLNVAGCSVLKKRSSVLGGV